LELHLGHRLCGLPALLRPELGRAPHTGPEHVFLELGVVAQRGRDQDPALLVELALDGGRQIETPESHDVLVELRHLRDLRLELLPRLHRVEVQAAIEERARQDEPEIVPGSEHVAIPRRQAGAPLRVNRVLELSAEHRAHDRPGLRPLAEGGAP
jgi:hypothetical protein